MKLLTLVVAIFSSLAFSAHEELDLSGKWELTATITEDDVPYTSILIFSPTSNRSEYGGALYDVVGDLDGIKVKSASIEVVDGDQHLVWWLERDTGIDLESNLILNISTDVLSLGGDFERYEVATMRRLGD